MKKALLILVVVGVALSAGLVSPPPAFASHCSYTPLSVSKSGSTVWGRGQASCSPSTSGHVVVCLQRWNGSSWGFFNCSQQNNQVFPPGGIIYFSLSDDCGNSTSFRSTISIYVHGAWQATKYGPALNC